MFLKLLVTFYGSRSRTLKKKKNQFKVLLIVKFGNKKGEREKRREKDRNYGVKEKKN